MERTFTVVIERDPESGGLVGSVVELPGCHTQAHDLQTLEANIREAIDAYLDAVNIEDEEPLPEFIGTMRVSVPVDARVPA